ncbi:fungal protein [Schizosaccharomyces cryophilus OY26]|uniref:Fungal protein n=1 Tax=Schizosaccharomyces cryophilus (strain OY26 / ATCC MYA-4695 / CBS 11777 / NBRC 106824 / NRRL Y48691) TaxID=653667 RepID=S9W1Q1_SCHCR|nr:uncharacterized protein SPOG_00367 [Schizosaccharomyces cryophilus OY26]EPY51945.1 fungal protein [Schizosaccharomyces cryophilus OY26]
MSPAMNSEMNVPPPLAEAKHVGKRLFSNQSDPRNTYPKEELPGSYRVLPPGTFSTLDYRDDRVNFHTDADGTITYVTRG